MQTELKSPSTGDYAILSHTWGTEEDEVTFQDLQEPDERKKKNGWSKIQECCEQAKKDGIDWVWIDTCCIDKRSSAELSEAINSMYAWYRDSAVCYVFLEDVPPLAPGLPENEFEGARWFTRGWCLQELIAPSKVEFYAKDWTDIGTRWSLHETIGYITGIPSSVLLDRDGPPKCSIAQKMSWASQRRTTRVEDEAYCLLGILDVNMPLLYGEGRKAFRRLLSEILKEHEDFSFLLWTAQGSQDIDESLAPAALELGFFHTEGLSLSQTRQCPYEEIEPAKSLPEPLSQALARRSPPQLTSRGLQVEMLVQSDPPRLEGLEHEETSLLFTEFMYKGKLVCIALDANDETDILTTEPSWSAVYNPAISQAPGPTNTSIVKMQQHDHQLDRIYTDDQILCSRPASDLPPIS
ncbi:heterokaryon incompatibility protein het-E-1 [Fusarium beomiforme]|uniref:Heterokaryon incompatibility protein het-E-1 n=1 Tax=Fusarium beomiforme TaxID=44412 RepID=A0A9P5AB38_9HYPO|nr:heterokaryon incompatibility protein het-E-1 [Fusarium beomiforme]